jgi:signal transduction histidine kinase/CheY-like chemotaxis protein
LQKTQNEFGDITRLISNFFEQRVNLIKEIADHKLAEEKLLESNCLLEETLAKLKDTQQKISQQERLRALGQLASGIAHDFNNALTPIMGYSDMILGSPKIQNDRKRMMDYLKIINTASSDARVVVDRLREFYRSREENEIFTPINLNQLIQQSIQLTQPKWKDQSLANSITVNIITDIQQIPPISGNEAELREVIANLIFNSVDAIFANGSISLRTYADNENVVFEISDTGIGMSEEIKKRCFEPFFTNKGEKGTGLGLSIVYGTIQRHNGTIEVESEIGKGTTFRIRLPITEEIQDKQKEQKSESILKPLHVLVIDDEVLIQDMLGEYLSIDGHTFELACNGREGLEKFRSGSFELVITDRAMPDINGDQLAFMIKQITTEVPVIMITGFGNIMKASGELPKNVDYLLSKPITLLEFRQTLKTAKELIFQQQ